MRSVCVIRTVVDNISTDRERRAGLSAITEPLDTGTRAKRARGISAIQSQSSKI